MVAVKLNVREFIKRLFCWHKWVELRGWKIWCPKCGATDELF